MIIYTVNIKYICSINFNLSNSYKKAVLKPRYRKNPPYEKSHREDNCFMRPHLTGRYFVI